MYTTQIERDVVTIYGWYTPEPGGEGQKYKELVLPKVPLLLASLTKDQVKIYRKVIEADGWREVGWYPSCHDTIATGYTVHLFCKEQDFPPSKEHRVPEWCKGTKSMFDAGHHSLSCSVQSCRKLVKKTAVVDYHRTIGIHRRTTPTKKITQNGWIRFATTPLASYWFWGLLPGEKDRFRLEPKGE